MQGVVSDLLGKRFGYLEVVSKAEKPKNVKNTGKYWLCRCDCGNTIVARADALVSGRKQSCKTCSYAIGGRKRSLNYGEASFNSLYCSYVCSARKKGLTFSLSKSDFFNLTQKNCYYCGISPSQSFVRGNPNGEFIYNGVDRVDSLKGYELNNVVSCCKTCNYAKRDMTQEEFYSWTDRLIEQRKNFIGASS
jgi:hypothetical protein